MSFSVNWHVNWLKKKEKKNYSCIWEKVWRLAGVEVPRICFSGVLPVLKKSSSVWGWKVSTRGSHGDVSPRLGQWESEAGFLRKWRPCPKIFSDFFGQHRLIAPLFNESFTKRTELFRVRWITRFKTCTPRIVISTLWGTKADVGRMTQKWIDFSGSYFSSTSFGIIHPNSESSGAHISPSKA